MRFSDLAIAIVGAIGVSIAPIAQAAHLGSIGQTYPIAEENALTMIMKKLREKERTGELKKLEAEAIRRSMHSIEHMPPVEGIVTATERDQRLIDPTIQYTQAVTTDEKRIVIPAGTRINPLDIVSLSKTLVFFDGRDPDQRDAVHLLIQRNPKTIKPILIAGSWLEMTRAWKTQVYYDQYGTLTKRFGVRAVPAVIRQHGKSLLLEEIPAKELMK